MISKLWAPLPRKRQKVGGGHRRRQELELLQPSEVAPRISVHFAELLLDWCDGWTSSKRLQRHAATFMGDGHAHPMATRLAEVGTDQNAQKGE